jgi:hypothetical protein
MAGQPERDPGTPVDLRTDRPHPARVYDYLLGGKDNFAADREAAQKGLPGSVAFPYDGRKQRSSPIATLPPPRPAPKNWSPGYGQDDASSANNGPPLRSTRSPNSPTSHGQGSHRPRGHKS